MLINSDDTPEQASQAVSRAPGDYQQPRALYQLARRNEKWGFLKTGRPAGDRDRQDLPGESWGLVRITRAGLGGGLALGVLEGGAVRLLEEHAVVVVAVQRQP